MLRRILRVAALCGGVALSACGGVSGLAGDVPGPSGAASGSSIVLSAGDVQAMCGASRPNGHRCLGYSLTQAGLKHAQEAGLLRVRSYGEETVREFGPSVIGNAAPEGYGPSDLLSAYNISASANGAGRVVALAESGDAPTLETDLAVYRRTYGLAACTIANGCLRKMAQDGSANLPPYDPNWAGETQLDVEMVSAMCPSCHILVVEANDESQGLDIAENAAAQAGAFAISNSWGGTENASEAPYFNHPGVIITVSSGDDGYGGGLQSPADFADVVAVGGTTLVPSNNARGWSETAWSETGGGCSAIISKPVWQKDTGCSKRMTADVSFVADPASGVAVYDGNPLDAATIPVGWRIAGGTSVGAPAVAALFALANISGNDASTLYANAAMLNDVVSGSTGTCSPLYFCNAMLGYDGPTGNGTPNGLASL